MARRAAAGCRRPAARAGRDPLGRAGRRRCCLPPPSCQALRHREREAKQGRQYLRALKLLNRIAAAITAHPDAAPRVLWQLAEAARRLLGMDRAGVLMLDGSAQTLELLAFSGDMPPEPPRLYRLQDLPACRAALAGGRVLFVGDVERDARLVPTVGARAATSSPPPRTTPTLPGPTRRSSGTSRRAASS